MKALSLRPEWALPVLLGLKTVEHRTWKTNYRGDLLICASSKKCPATIAGHALCTVELLDIEPFKPVHMYDAYTDEMPSDGYAWRIRLKDWIEPFPVKGKLNLFEVDEPLKVIPDKFSNREALKTFYEPLVYWGRNEKDSRKLFEEVVKEAEQSCWIA